MLIDETPEWGPWVRDHSLWRFAFSRCEQAGALLDAWHGALMDWPESVHLTGWRSKPGLTRSLCSFKISLKHRTSAAYNPRNLTWSDRTYFKRGASVLVSGKYRSKAVDSENYKG